MKLVIFSTLTNFHVVEARSRWSKHVLEGESLYRRDDVVHFLNLLATPVDRRPPRLQPDPRLDLVLDEYETEDGRTRSGRGRTWVFATLYLPQPVFDELRSLHEMHGHFFKRRWAFEIDTERFEFPKSRTIEPDTPIPDRWTKRLMLDMIDLTLFEIGMVFEDIKDLHPTKRDRLLEQGPCDKSLIARWRIDADGRFAEL